MLENLTDLVATEYIGKTVTVRNAKYFGSVQSGTCVLVTFSANGVESVKMEGIDTCKISNGSEYQASSEYYWNIESVL